MYCHVLGCSEVIYCSVVITNTVNLILYSYFRLIVFHSDVFIQNPTTDNMSGLANTFDLKDEEQVKEYLRILGIEYRFQCYHQKLPDGCHRLADYLEAFMFEFKKARTVYQMNCVDNNFGHSCYKYGHYLMLGKGGEKDTKTAHEMYTKGCNLGHGPACYNVALMHQSGEVENGKKDFVKAKDYLHLACDKKDIPSCAMLSAYYLTGKAGVPKDMKMAFKYAETSCKNEHIVACVNLSQMYKRGDGVEKDLDLATKCAKKAKELHQSHKEAEPGIKFGE